MLWLVHFTSGFLSTPNVATPNMVTCDLYQIPARSWDNKLDEIRRCGSKLET